MKLTFAPTVLLLAVFSFCTARGEVKLELREQAPAVGEEEYLYEIKENEVLVNDKLIMLFAISKDGISASYRNKTEEKTKPKYTVSVYNAYGLLIGKKTLGDSISLFGASTYMEPGEVGAEKIHLDAYPLSDILKNSNVRIPGNIMEMRWIVLSDTNTK